MIKRHQAIMRNGYSIPVTMWWLFWPIGAVKTKRRGQRTIEVIDPVVAANRIERQFKITNHDEWMARLVELKVVRPQ